MSRKAEAPDQRVLRRRAAGIAIQVVVAGGRAPVIDAEIHQIVVQQPRLDPS
jgi:hypothetical protein